jgi:hypothetical protein
MDMFIAGFVSFALIITAVMFIMGIVALILEMMGKGP